MTRSLSLPLWLVALLFLLAAWAALDRLLVPSVRWVPAIAHYQPAS